MSFAASALLLAAGMFVGMLVLLEAGRRLGARRAAPDPEKARVGLAAVEGAIFALMGLLIAFTFAGAASRFDARRDLIVRESNAIGTAWLRLDLLPPASQPRLRDLFRQYVDSRLESYRKLPDLAAAQEWNHSTALQGEIWKAAVLACGEPGMQPALMLLLPALNEMIDITSARRMAGRTHLPVIIFVLLVALALVSALLVGLGMAGGTARNWIHRVLFAAVLSVCVYVILDLEYPRFGLIRIDAVDQMLVDLRRSMD